MNSTMGITIHFEGGIRAESDLSEVVNRARRFATDSRWHYVDIPEEIRSLSRVRNEKDWDYFGLTSGIEIVPHEDCEPLRLEFDDENYIQEYTKTQFAPVSVHISIVDLLRQIEPYFVSLDVVDESDFWDTKDVAELEKSLSRFFEVVEDEKNKNPKLTGPYRLENGRIADLLEN